MSSTTIREIDAAIKKLREARESISQIFFNSDLEYTNIQAHDIARAIVQLSRVLKVLDRKKKHLSRVKQ